MSIFDLFNEPVYSNPFGSQPRVSPMRSRRESPFDDFFFVDPYQQELYRQQQEARRQEEIRRQQLRRREELERLQHERQQQQQILRQARAQRPQRNSPKAQLGKPLPPQRQQQRHPSGLKYPPPSPQRFYQEPEPQHDSESEEEENDQIEIQPQLSQGAPQNTQPLHTPTQIPISSPPSSPFPPASSSESQPIQEGEQEGLSSPTQKKLAASEALRHEAAATRLQKVFSGRQVRKAVDRVKKLAQVERQVHEIQQNYRPLENRLHALDEEGQEEVSAVSVAVATEQQAEESTVHNANNLSSRLERLKRDHRELLGLDEQLTRQLFSLDAIPSGQWDFVRERRKGIVSQINASLEASDRYKRRLAELMKGLEQQIVEQQRQEEARKQQQLEQPQQEEESPKPEIEPQSPASIETEEEAEEPELNNTHSNSSDPAFPLDQESIESQLCQLKRTISEKDLELERVHAQLEREKKLRAEAELTLAEKERLYNQQIVELQEQLKKYTIAQHQKSEGGDARRIPIL